MRKFSALWMMVGLSMLAACGTSTDPEENAEKKSEVTQENESAETSPENTEEDEQASISEENQDESEEASDTTESEAGEEDSKSDEETVKGDDPEVADDQEMLMDLGYEILHAQNNEDYEFLESILAEGASMDEETNTFTFENISAPHDLEFVQANDSEIEYRYMEEIDSETMIVGFAVVDYEAESSFTIDFEFVQENDVWKMNDMEKNA